VFTDLSLMTAIANGISCDEVFAEPLRLRMTGGDMLVAISSSGNSSNIVRAVQIAKALGGTVITILAMGEDNIIRRKGDLNFYVPGKTYGLPESRSDKIYNYSNEVLQARQNKVII
jgi:D-sedoheptulose 7-phosphate isomerase